MKIFNKQYCWILLVIVVLLLEGMCNGCLDEERIALLQIKSFFNDSSYLFSWESHNNVDCCNWDRVVCNETTSQVISLDLYYLSDVNIEEEWYLDASLFLPFQQLKNLSLRGNNFNGCVKNAGFERLSALSNLELLNLRYNNFNNSILPYIGGLSSLKYLYLSYNRLQGTTNMRELLKLMNLEGIGLSSSGLNNSNILSILNGFSSLRILYLGYNQLEGQFNLKELHNLKSLEELDLSGNSNITKFVGSTDEHGLTKLNVLWLEEMIIDGRSQLLESLRVFPYLTALYLSYSNFTNGARFGSAGSYNWSNLEELYLDGSVMDENFLLSIKAAMPSLKLLSCTEMKNPLILTTGSPNFKYLEHMYMNDSTINSNFFYKTLEI